VALQGGAERFKLCYRPEAPFCSHREFAGWAGLGFASLLVSFDTPSILIEVRVVSVAA
jgi:hypothetical protein